MRIVILFLAGLSSGLALVPESHPSYPAMLGTTRLGLYLVATANRGQDLVDRTFAQTRLQQFMATPPAAEIWVTSLQAGDPAVWAAARDLLRLSNVPEAAHESILTGFKTDDARKMMAAAGERPSQRERLLELVLSAVPDDGTALVRYQQWREQASPTWLALLPEGGKTKGTTPLERLQEAPRWLQWWRGAESWRTRINQGTGIGWAAAFWSYWATTATPDPLYQREATERLSARRELTDTLERWLVQHSQKSLGKITDIYLEAAQKMPGTRYADWKTNLEALYGYSPLRTGAEYTQLWKENLQRDPQARKALLWHLTRPANALGDATAQGLANLLRDEPRFAEVAGRILTGASPEVQAEAERRGITTPQLRTLLNEPRALSADVRATLAGEIARQLPTWPRLLQALLREDSPMLSEGLGEAVRRYPNFARVWCEVILWTDPDLQRNWLEWQVRSRRAVDGAAARRWLELAQGSLKSGQGPEGGEFRQWFSAFVAEPNAKHALLRRLALESWGVPEGIRDMLREAWRTDHDLWWQWRIRATAYPDAGAGIMRRTALRLLKDPIPAQMTLQAVVKRTPGLDWVSDPLLTLLLQNPVMKQAVSDRTKDGGGEAARVGRLVLADALVRQKEIALPVVAQFKEGRYQGEPGWETLIKDLREGNTISAERVARLLAIREVGLWWEKSLPIAFLTGGREAWAAEIVAGNPQLQRLWADNLQELLSKEPTKLQQMLNFLPSCSNGDNATRYFTWEERLIEEDLRNGSFYETILLDPTGGMALWVENLSRP